VRLQDQAHILVAKNGDRGMFERRMMIRVQSLNEMKGNHKELQIAAQIHKPKNKIEKGEGTNSLAEPNSR
jgi:hypothetical protein